MPPPLGTPVMVGGSGADLPDQLHTTQSGVKWFLITNVILSKT